MVHSVSRSENRVPPMRNTTSLAAVLSLALVFSSASLMAQAPPLPELSTLDERYATELRDKVVQPHQAAMQRLNESYRVTLDTALKKAAGEGKLDEVLAWQT